MPNNQEKRDVPHTPEEVMAQFAKNAEAQSGVNGPVESPAKRVPKTNQEAFRQTVEEMHANKPTLQEERADVMNARRTEQHEYFRQGYMKLPLEDLPTGGIFYPQGSSISIRAASGQDIRNWSMMNESEILEIDAALNNILQRCATITIAGQPGSWKDLKEIDRLYIILAIRDYTFTDGHNDLKVVLSETEDIVVKKENISFIDIPEGLMKHYNPAKLGFTIQTDNPSLPELTFYLPQTGVNNWLRGYIQAKREAQQPLDTDFIQIAPMLISDHKALNEKSYIDLVNKSQSFSMKDWSIIAHVKKTIEDSIKPKVKYNDESGAEQEVPLNFRGGLKSIFNYDVSTELGF